MKKALHQKIQSILKLEPGKRFDILDIGCGKGYLLGCLSKIVAPESRLLGIDALEKSIKKARRKYPNVAFNQEKFVDSFSFTNHSFDLIVCVDVLECIPDKAAFLSEVARILRPNGKIVFAHWDWSTMVYHSKHKELVRKFVNAFSDCQQDWMDECDGQMGRKLWGELEGSGWFKGVMDSFTLIETKFEKGQYGFDLLQGSDLLIKKGLFQDDRTRNKRGLTSIFRCG